MDKPDKISLFSTTSFVSQSTLDDGPFVEDISDLLPGQEGSSEFVARYLLSTPERELASELVEALREIADPIRGVASHGDPVVLRDHARAVLAKLEGK